jgi:hypothetical protein
MRQAFIPSVASVLSSSDGDYSEVNEDLMCSDENGNQLQGGLSASYLSNASNSKISKLTPLGWQLLLTLYTN